MKKEINDIIEKLLKKKGLTKEELVFDKLFCIRKYIPKINRENYIWHALRDANMKKDYPEGETAKENPVFFGRSEYAFMKDHNRVMYHIYEEYLQNKNLEQICYDTIELLYDELLTGFAYILQQKIWFEEIDGKSNISKEIEEYIKNNGYFGLIGRKTQFSYCDYGWLSLKEFKNLDDLLEKVYNEISQFLEEYCYFVFIPEEFTSDEIYKQELTASAKQICSSFKTLKGDARAKYLEEIKELLNKLDKQL